MFSLACTPSFPDVTWMGDYLHVAQEATGLVCEGSNPYQDRYVARLAELLDVALDEPIRFAYIEREEIETYCFQEDFWGCYYDDRAYSIFPVLTHELAHAVADRAGWQGTRVFVEGFAEAFGSNNKTDVERVPIRDVVERFTFNLDNYYTAGLFVRFLVEDYGLENFAAFMRTTERDADFAAVSISFEAALGVPIESAFDAFDAYPTCSAWANQVASVECGQEPSPWGPDGLDITVALDCEEDTTVGPNNDEMSSSRSLEITEDGTYELAVSSTSDKTSGIRLSHCGDCREAFDEIVLADTTRTFDLSAGEAGFVAKSLPHAGRRIQAVLGLTATTARRELPLG